MKAPPVMIGFGLFCRRLLHFFIGVSLLGAVVEAGVAIFSIVVGPGIPPKRTIQRSFWICDFMVRRATTLLPLTR